MNTIVLGGRSKFGLVLSDYLSRQHHKVLAIGREDFDLSSGWVTLLHKRVLDLFGSPDNVDTVVINVYDYRPGYSDVQQRVFDTCWQIFKDKQVQLVVIGSMIHYFRQDTEYAKTKKALLNHCIRVTQLPHVAKLLFVEPGVLENAVDRHSTPHAMYFEELAEKICTFMKINDSYLHVALRGKHKSSTMTGMKNES